MKTLRASENPPFFHGRFRTKKKAQGGLSTHDGERNPIYPALGGWPRAIYIAPDALRQASMDTEPVVRKTCHPTMSTSENSPEANDRPGYSDLSERAPWALVTGTGPLKCSQAGRTISSCMQHPTESSLAFRATLARGNSGMKPRVMWVDRDGRKNRDHPGVLSVFMPEIRGSTSLTSKAS